MLPHLRSHPHSQLEPILERVRAVFGEVPAWKRRDPLSQLIWAIVNEAAPRHVAQGVYERLKARFYPWKKLAEARFDEIKPLLAPLPSASGATQALTDAMRAIQSLTGGLRLEWLAEVPASEAVAWLEELPGVDLGIATAVLNLSTLQRRIMVVDDNVLRTLKRLGVVEADETPSGCVEVVSELAPATWTAQDFTDFYILLGRLSEWVCRLQQPNCGACALRPLCRQGTAHASARQAPHANENRPRGDRLDDYLRRRIAKLERDGVCVQTLVDSGVSWGCAEIDAVFVGGKLPAGVHQSSGDRMEDGAVALFPALATAVRLPKTGPRRLLVIQEADVRREYGELHGPGLEAFGLEASEVAFARVRSAEDALACADEALRHHACATILLELRRSAALADLSVTRRFNLAARRSGTFLFLVTPDLGATSAAVTRWKISASASEAPRRRVGPPALALELTRNRAGALSAQMYRSLFRRCSPRPWRQQLSHLQAEQGETLRPGPFHMGRRG